MQASNEEQRLGSYHLIERLGRGGMAEVWKAKIIGPAGFQRTVALKRILPHLAEEEPFVRMFAAEARVMSRLHHPNVVQTFELGESGGEMFLAMELVDGWTLAKAAKQLKRRGPMPAGFGAYVVRELCRALDYAHGMQDGDGKSLALVHRDVSPSNVMITFDGTVKLLDFGIAKAVDSMSDARTRTGVLKGKLAYMSPEQVAAEKLDPRSDQFSAGVILHELLTGERLFYAESELSTMKMVAEALVDPPSQKAPDLPPALDEICLRALKRAREDRYPSCEALGSALDPVLQELGFGTVQVARMMQQLREDDISEAPPPSPSRRTAVLGAQPSGAGRWLLLLGGLAVLGGAAGAYVMFASRAPHVAPQKPPTAQTSPAAPALPTVTPPVAAQPIAAPPDKTPVKVAVTSTPAGAELFVDGRAAPEGRTPLTLTLDRGDKTIKLLLKEPHSEPYPLEVVPSSDQRFTVELSPLAVPAPPPASGKSSSGKHGGKKHGDDDGDPKPKGPKLKEGGTVNPWED